MIVQTFYNPVTGMTKVLWLRNAAVVRGYHKDAVLEALNNHAAYKGPKLAAGDVYWRRERTANHVEWEVPTALAVVHANEAPKRPVDTATYPQHLTEGHMLTDDDVTWILAVWQKQYRR